MKIIKYFVLCVAVISAVSCAAPAVRSDGLTGIGGVVTAEDGQPEEDVFVYLYRSLSSRLIGPADFMEKTDATGRFLFDVPEGSYYVVARKRIQGGGTGPVRSGDRSAVYGQNPVVVAPGSVRTVLLRLPVHTALLAKRMPVGDTPLSIRLTGRGERPLKLLVYGGDGTKGAPRFIMEIEGATAEFRLDRGQRYFVVVREDVREKINAGELYAEFGPFAPEELTGPIELRPERRP